MSVGVDVQLPQTSTKADVNVRYEDTADAEKYRVGIHKCNHALQCTRVKHVAVGLDYHPTMLPHRRLLRTRASGAFVICAIAMYRRSVHSAGTGCDDSQLSWNAITQLRSQ